MVRQEDVILEGVKAGEVASLRALAAGQAMPARGEIALLQAKGWVDMVGEDALITLTGRALLDHPPLRLR